MARNKLILNYLLFGSPEVDAGVDIWAYCLMPNHVHLVVVPGEGDSLARLFRQVHRRYSRYINFREKWKGHLWQERFHSFVMDEQYLLATVRYVELNPVKAKLCLRPEDWLWSSAKAHMLNRIDEVVNVAPMLDRVGDWQGYLLSDPTEIDPVAIQKHTGSGRPAGGEGFLEHLESVVGRPLKKVKPGPKPRIK
jgi:putative transposase